MRIFISPGHNFFGRQDQRPGEHPTVPVNEIECVAGRGLRGDRFFGFKENYKGQVTFFASEVFADVCQKLGAGEKSPGVTRRNVITSGVDLNSLVGKEFLVQGIEFEGVAECSPCHWMNHAIAPGAEAALHGRGGLRARVLTDGVHMKPSRESKVESREPVAARQLTILDPRPSALDQKFSAVILAGGKSSRMGRDKAWLEIGGQTLLARQIELVRAVGATEIFISGRTEGDYSTLGCQVLQDRFQNAGPLAGIERALNTMTSPLLLVLAVDMPQMSGAFLESLRAVCAENSGAIPQVDGRIEPLAAFYPKASLDLAVEMLGDERAGSETGAPGPTDFARECLKLKLATLVEVSAAEVRYFTNLNSPEDLRTKGNSML